jgi:hypothetical protein
MRDPVKSASKAPDSLSRRQAIVGALALAAGALVATKPRSALATNYEPFVVGVDTFSTRQTSIFRTSNQTVLGTQYSTATLNKIVPITAADHAVDGTVWPGALAGSVGVCGRATTTGQFGVLASHDLGAGTALRVEGKAQFSRSGKATISKGHASKTVTGLSNITTDSIILVTLQGSAGVGNHVRWAKRLSSTSFQVMLTKAASINVTFGWLILN